MKNIIKWFKNLFKPKILVEDIEKILQFERDVEEMKTDRQFHSMAHYKMWCYIWMRKCEAIHAMINKDNKNNYGG